jgi:hypothetical protein
MYSTKLSVVLNILYETTGSSVDILQVPYIFHETIGSSEYFYETTGSSAYILKVLYKFYETNDTTPDVRKVRYKLYRTCW